MNQKILLVEDEAILALTTTKILEKHDFEVVTVSNGEKAITAVNEDPEISLILMDINLGKGIDGTETAQEILKSHDIPIIFHTSHAEKEYVDKVKKITRYGYVLKNSGEFVLKESINMGFELFESQSELKKELIERKQLERKLLSEEKKIMTWLQQSPICTKIVDCDFNLQFMSDAGFEMLKLDNNDAVYGKSYPFSFFPEDFRRTMLYHLEESRSTKVITSNSGWTNDVIGNEVWLQSTIVPILDTKQEVDYFLVFSFNVTDLKQKEDQLNRYIFDLNVNRKELEILQEATYSVLEDASFKSTAQKLFSCAKEISDARSGYIALLSEDGSENDIVYLDSGGLPCTVDPSLPMPIRGLREEAYRTNKAVYHNGFMKSEWVKYMPKGHVVLNNVMFAPLIIEGKTVGIIGLANKETDFNNSDLKSVGKLADLAAIALINSRNKEKLHKTQKDLQRALTNKDSLMKELNHRVKNNLAMVSSLIYLKNSETTEDLSDLKHRIDVIKLVHEKLHQQNDGEHIEVKEYFQELLVAIFSSTSKVDVDVVNTIEKMSIPTKIAIPLGLIVNEIATNAIKYGFIDEEKARFTIDMNRDTDDQQYILTISNSGNPFPEDKGLDNLETMGLHLVTTLVSQIDGSIELQKSPYPVFTIRFPIEEE